MTEKGFGNNATQEVKDGNSSAHRISRNGTAREAARAIARHVAQLEKRFGRITACRVALKGPGQHRRTGGLFEVHIRLALPDEKEVNVGHKPDADERHTDVNFAINDAFKRARGGLQDQVRRLQGHVKTHESLAEAAWPTTESAADKTST